MSKRKPKPDPEMIRRVAMAMSRPDILIVHHALVTYAAAIETMDRTVRPDPENRALAGFARDLSDVFGNALTVYDYLEESK